MPKLPSVFRRKRNHKLASNSSSDHPGDASTWQCTLQVTPGSTPSWATQPWHYVFQVSANLKYENDCLTRSKQNGDEAWALGVNGRWRLVRVIGDGFLDNIEVSNCALTIRVLANSTVFVCRTGSSSRTTQLGRTTEIQCGGRSHLDAEISSRTPVSCEGFSLMRGRAAWRVGSGKR